MGSHSCGQRERGDIPTLLPDLPPDEDPSLTKAKEQILKDKGDDVNQEEIDGGDGEGGDSDGSDGVSKQQQMSNLDDDNEGKIYDFESHTFKSVQYSSPTKFVSSIKKNTTKILSSLGLKSRRWLSDSTAIRANLMRSVRRKRLEEVKARISTG